MRTRKGAGFETSGASVCGGAHRQLGRSCQDGLSILSRDGLDIAVITDGCGSSPLSEVGANLGARLWAEALAREASERGVCAEVIGAAKERVNATLETLIDALPGPRSETIRDLFLYTVLATVIDGERALIFAIGDGVVGINGAFSALNPGAENAPAYHGYELAEETASLGEVTFLAIRLALEVESVVLATDGAMPLLEGSTPKTLHELCAQGSIFRNQDKLRRDLEKLATPRSSIDWERERVSRTRATLDDDTTIVSLRRVSAAAEVCA